VRDAENLCDDQFEIGAAAPAGGEPKGEAGALPTTSPAKYCLAGRQLAARRDH
jgi:hypothetical protein